MFFGPVFTREVAVVPRREWTYIVRSVYAGLLLLLTATAWLVISGTQLITDTGDFARFGTMLFQFIAPVQLVLSVFFAAILAAGAVGQEKERKTLLLLLLTDMSSSELVLGKLTASLLNILLMLAVSIPVLMSIAVLGGVSYCQITRILLVTVFSMFLCGSIGSCIALWRDKTFQAVAATILVIVLYIAVWVPVGYGLFGQTVFGISADKVAAAFSPWNAVIEASRPAVYIYSVNPFYSVFVPIGGFLLVCGSIAVLVNLTAILMVRVWNPSRETRNTAMEEDTWFKSKTKAAEQTLAETLTVDAVAKLEEQRTQETLNKETQTQDALTQEQRQLDRQKSAAITAEGGRIRHVWNNPIVWREIMTRAYGRKIWIIQFGFLAFFAMCAVSLHQVLTENVTVTVTQMAGPLIPLFLLSLILVNVQAVTSQTSEKDGGTFDLLLVSDISPKEYVFGKIGGVFYNMKFLVLLPLCLCAFLYWEQAIGGLSLFFLFSCLTVLYAFSAMTGIYIGMQYENTRAATATSLGIMFFLFVGIAACIWIMVAFSGSFETQLVPFSAFMVGGGIGLYITLGVRNPSSAIALSSFILPLAVFYLITTMLLGAYHLVFVVLVSSFGFTTAAMLIPCIAEFDLAAGRTNAD
ncbi:hypothetical protein FACS189427_05580 [Planctomycetales bacterium]|nr:hypothetical protein FACS189427_05580 [Planctomycetales bacterium]